MISNWVFCKDPKKFYPDLSDKELDKVEKSLKEVKNDYFVNNPTLKKFGWHNDFEIFRERFQLATNKDISIHQPTLSDIKVFKYYMKSWTKSIEKGFEGSFYSWKILPAKLSKLPLGPDTHNKINHVLSYERRHKRAAMNNLSTIKDVLKKLAGRKHFNVDTKNIANLEMAMMSTNDTRESESIRKELDKELGGLGSLDARKSAGDLFYGIIDIMEGMSVNDLKKVDGRTPWTAQEKKYARQIRNAWVNTRKDLAYVAINALRAEKAFAERLDLRENHARGLGKYLDTIETKIKELEFVDKDGKDKFYELSGQRAKEFGLDGKKLRKDYVPHHILTMVKHLDLFHDWMESPNPEMNVMASEKFRDHLLTSDRSTIDRLRSRGETGEEYYSRNPLFFMSQYVHDITRYNYKRSLETVLADAFDSLIKSKEFASRHRPEDVDQVVDFTEEAIRTLNNIAKESIVTDSPSDTRGRKLSRLFTSLAFIRTMGYNVRSPLKNYTQKFFEYIDLGYRASAKSESYISGDIRLKNVMDQAQEKHGLFWEKNDSFLKKLTSTYNDAAATRGTKEAGMLPPGLAEVNGKVMVVNESLFDKTLRVIDKVADVGSLMHKGVETVIRQHTFRTAYGLAHQNLSEIPKWWLLNEMGRKKATDDEIRSWIDRTAGQLAYNKVIDIHYEYSQLQKPDIIKGPVGAVVGQFKQYRFSNIDMQYNWIRSGLRRIRSGGFAEYEAMRLYRLGTAYGISAGLSAMTGLGFSNLFQNDTWEWISNHIRYWTADRSTKEGREIARRALYGKGELSELGPTFSSIFELFEVFGLMKIDHDHKLAILGITNDISPTENLNDMDRNYRLTRLANLQAARSWFHTREAALNKHYWKAGLIETGLFGSSWHQDTSDKFLKFLRDITGTKSYEKRSDIRRRRRLLKQSDPMYAHALKSLDLFPQV